MTITLAALAFIAMAVLSYAVLVTIAWLRYGRPSGPNACFADAHLDRFMPEYDVVERHSMVVNAPAAVTLEAAMDHELGRSLLIRGIFHLRAMLLGAQPVSPVQARGLVAQMKAMGWGELAEVPDHEIVMGAVTQPWCANVRFLSLRQTEFARFTQPGLVKIVWTLRADPLGDGRSVFITETRAVALGADARRRFRWYWARFSPGIWLIRQASMMPIKFEAERRLSDRRLRKPAA